MESQNNIAVFVDFENIAAAAEDDHRDLELTRLFDFLKSRGRVTIKRAYGDWRRYSRHRSELLENAVNLVQLYSYGMAHKNGADIRLCIEAIETLFTHPNIQTYVIVSGDSDYSSLISKLREYGKYTLGIGLRRSTSEILIKSMDEFVFYEALVGTLDLTQEFDVSEAHALLLRSLRSFEQQDELPVFAGKLKQRMVAFDPAFNETYYGYDQFKTFLEDSTDIVRLEIRDDQMYVTPLNSREMAQAATQGELRPLAETYKRYLRRVGLPLVELSTRRAVLSDLFDLFRTTIQPLSLDQAAAILRERYDGENILRPQTQVRDVLRLAYRSGCLEFDHPPSLAAAAELHHNVGLDEFTRNAEGAYVRKIVEGGLQVDLLELASALFGAPDYADYVETLLGDLLSTGVIEQRNGAYSAPPPASSSPLALHPALMPVLPDLEGIEPPPEAVISSQEARRQFDEGTRLRARDFAASASKYLLATKTQQMALEMGETGATLEELKWYLAGYCSVQAGHRFVEREYERSIPYYLSFFYLAYSDDTVQERVRGLMRPMLSYYFAIAARRFEPTFQAQPNASPSQLAFQLHNHPNPAVGRALEDLLARLSHVTLTPIRTLLKQLPTVLGDMAQKERTAAFLNKLLAQPADPPADPPDKSVQPATNGTAHP
ncbi:MAG: NYN domain-containing protein [Anaerolineae bacterium]|nr:NYN domain-containing protein [Anaerolineae bacterium]